jgi:glutaredoxin
MPRPVSVLNRRFIAAATAALLLSLVPAPAGAGCGKSVILYSAWWCPYCKQVRAILARNDIKYSLLDATTPRVQAMMVKRFGDTAVPRTVIGGAVVEGVDEARIKQLCRVSEPDGQPVTMPEFPLSPHGAGRQVAAATTSFPLATVR